MIRKNVSPESTWNLIKPGAPGNVICDENNLFINVSCFVDVFVDIDGRLTVFRFNVVEGFAASVIIGCNYYEYDIEAIRPRKRIVELDDATTVPLITRPDRRP